MHSRSSVALLLAFSLVADPVTAAAFDSPSSSAPSPQNLFQEQALSVVLLTARHPRKFLKRIRSFTTLREIPLRQRRLLGSATESSRLKSTLGILTAGGFIGFAGGWGSETFWLSVPFVIASFGQSFMDPDPPALRPLSNFGDWRTVILSDPLFALVAGNELDKSCVVIYPPESDQGFPKTPPGVRILNLLHQAVEQQLPGAADVLTLIEQGEILFLKASMVKASPGEDYDEAYTYLKTILWEARLSLQIKRWEIEDPFAVARLHEIFELFRNPATQQRLSSISSVFLENVSAYPVQWMTTHGSSQEVEDILRKIFPQDSKHDASILNTLLTLFKRTEPELTQLWELRELSDGIPQTLAGSFNYFSDMSPIDFMQQLFEVQKALAQPHLDPTLRINLNELAALLALPWHVYNTDLFNRVNDLRRHLRDVPTPPAVSGPGTTVTLSMFGAGQWGPLTGKLTRSLIVFWRRTALSDQSAVLLRAA